MTRRSQKWLVFACMAAALGCGNQNQLVQGPPPDVTVSLPIRKTVTEYLEFTGATQPLETIEIRARVKGFLKERHFQEGAEVPKDKLLFVIDEEPFKIQRDAALAKQREAEVALTQAKESKAREVARAKLSLANSQLRLAQQEQRRLQKLFDDKVSTQAELDQVNSTLKTREAEVDSAQANLDQATTTYDTSIASAEAAVTSAKIAVRNAILDLSYCRMSAPITGRISKYNQDIDNLVGDGTSTLLATIVRVAPLQAYATLSEGDILKTPNLLERLKASGGSKSPVKVDLGLATTTDYPFSGTIDYIDPAIDVSTGTLRIRGEFKNEKGNLLPGMFVRMRIVARQIPNALLVPERALGTDQSGQYLLIVGKDNKVEYRSVKVGITEGPMRVVEGEIKPDDRIIVDGLMRAQPGTEVSPHLEERSAPPGDATAAAPRS